MRCLQTDTFKKIPAARRYVATGAFAIGIAVLSVVIFVSAMTKSVGRDEHMYCTGGALLAHGELIYRDFSYVAQLPYHPLLLGAMYRLFRTEHYLLIGRLVSVLCDILVMSCIVIVCRRAYRECRLHGVVVGLALALLYLYNPLVDYANGYAWNHDVVMACVMLSYVLFSLARPEKRLGLVRIAAIALLLTAATCMRATTALIQLIFFIAICHRGPTMRDRMRSAGVFAAGSVTGAIPLAVIVSLAPRAFSLNVFRIPLLNSELLHEMRMAHDKWSLATAAFSHPVYFILLLLALFLLVADVALRRRAQVKSSATVLSSLIALLFVVIAFIPPTMWRQYLAMPVPFFAVAAACSLGQLKNQKTIRLARAGHVAGLCLLVSGLLIGRAFMPSPFHDLAKVARPSSWVPVRYHDLSRRIAAPIKQAGPILTTAPLLAIEGGGSVYAELSAGIFVYRVADRLSERERRTVHAVDPETIDELAERQPPAAVIVGAASRYFTFLEEPFANVIDERWGRTEFERGLVVYYRP